MWKTSSLLALYFPPPKSSGEAPRDTKTSTRPSNVVLRLFLDVAKPRSASVRYCLQQGWPCAVKCLSAPARHANFLRVSSTSECLTLRFRLLARCFHNRSKSVLGAHPSRPPPYLHYLPCRHWSFLWRDGDATFNSTPSLLGG